ncbi:hypothetical protein V1478_012654 [Vespula squamosa]|uniref:Uncharacterized protein n=1 Tax=Vespula squamosa TaxID=30214 RepID=A0ABD2A8K3_VESSQ
MILLNTKCDKANFRVSESRHSSIMYFLRQFKRSRKEYAHCITMADLLLILQNLVLNVINYRQASSRNIIGHINERDVSSVQNNSVNLTIVYYRVQQDKYDML